MFCVNVAFDFFFFKCHKEGNSDKRCTAFVVVDEIPESNVFIYGILKAYYFVNHYNYLFLKLRL